MTTLAVAVEDHAPSAERDCAFCAALAPAAPARERAVLASHGFVAWVSRGALAEGHLLVIPRRHVLSLVELSDAERDALSGFLAVVKRSLERHYGPVCAFEHGPDRPGSPVGCSVDHAHLHAIPWPSSLVALAEGDYPELGWRRAPSLVAALADRPAGPYVVVEDHDGTASIATGPDIPSQALRRTIAAATGRREEWDWKAYPQTSTVAQTLQRMADR